MCLTPGNFAWEAAHNLKQSQDNGYWAETGFLEMSAKMTEEDEEELGQGVMSRWQTR